jgi:predicted PurR-regulated permease PerM
MENKPVQESIPVYFKVTAILLGLVLITYILNALGDVLVPFAFSILISILLNPLYVRLERWMPKTIAIILTILLAIIVVASLLYLLSTQISVFTQSIPLLKQKSLTLLGQLQQWSMNNFGISIQKQINALINGLSNGGDFLKNTLGTILGTVSVVLLIPIYIFMLLFYKPLIIDFLFQVFSERYSLRVAEILSQTKGAVQSFMVGLMIETTIVCILNSVALLIIGVPSAIVIGVIGGILNILPYIGGIIAIALPVLMVTVTREGFTGQLLVIGSYLVIQFIDNNILVPRIVSKKVQINALMSILVVLLGGALWGVSGMFLSIPFIGVLKIIFDRIDELKPWGRLLGDEVPTEHIGIIWQKRWDRIFRRIQKKKEMETLQKDNDAEQQSA